MVLTQQHGQSSDSQLSADIRALIKTLSDMYSQGKSFPNMSHTQNADFISTLQFTTKTRIHSVLFLIHIYIQLCPNPSLGLDHCCHA